MCLRTRQQFCNLFSRTYFLELQISRILLHRLSYKPNTLYISLSLNNRRLFYLCRSLDFVLHSLSFLLSNLLFFNSSLILFAKACVCDCNLINKNIKERHSLPKLSFYILRDLFSLGEQLLGIVLSNDCLWNFSYDWIHYLVSIMNS